MSLDMDATQAIQLVCLDMAGTTVQDGGAVEKAFLAALASAGVGGDDPRLPGMLDYVTATMGRSKIRVFEALFPDDAAMPPIVNAAFEVAYGAIVAAGDVAPIPGAEQTMQTLREAGMQIALLTGFSAQTRDNLVKALDWYDVADVFVCPEEAGRGRPYPDMVFEAIMTLGIDSVRATAVVGDTAADIECGLRSGASVVAGVLTGADSHERLLDAGATAVLASVRDLPALLGCT